jgi:ComF family protein
LLDPVEKKSDSFICSECGRAFEPLPVAHCHLCGQPFVTPLTTVHTCGWCLIRPPAYTRAAAAGLYEGPLRQAIHRFKYEGRTGLVQPLARFMATHLREPFYPPAVDMIVPVPLHPKRLRQRGFNQSLVLSRRLFEHDHRRIVVDLLERCRWTQPQMLLKGEARRENMKDAFAVRKPARVSGRSVMIVDDVYTTGTTVSECARVLKRAGATVILVLTLARVR